MFDGVDTIGEVFLNQPLPPRVPRGLDACFTRMQNTLPDPTNPYFKELSVPRALCEQASLSDPLSAGFSMLHADQDVRCWLYHNVSKVSNTSANARGDWYRKIHPAPPACAPAPVGFGVKDQFLRYAFPVKDKLARGGGGENQLTVRLDSVAGLGPGGIHAEWVKVRKEPSNFGYDWSPIAETQGIWMPVYLVAQARLVLLDMVATVHVQDAAVATAAGPKQQRGGVGLKFIVKVATRLNLTTAATVQYTAKGNWSSEPVSRTLHLPAGVSEVVDELDAADVQLWWPAGYGAQPLYDVDVSVQALPPTAVAAAATPRPAITSSRRVGFRSVAIDASRHAGNSTQEHHIYVVNGVRIFAQGANWVPPDSFEARATDEDLCHLLARAKASNMNFLRIWGGGIYPQDAFFDCADELGILLEQDLIFSNGVYETDPAFLELVSQEVGYQVRRLASHPSLFMWSGSNELSPWSKAPGDWWSILFPGTVMPAVAKIDTSRPVWAACPASAWGAGVDPATQIPSGAPFLAGYTPPPFTEVHAYWFRNCDTPTDAGCLVKGLYCMDDAFYAHTSFASEFGWIGMPSFESLAPMLGPSAEYTMHSAAMVDRQNRITPISTSEDRVRWVFGRHAAPFIDTADEAAFKRVIHMSMVAQSDCVKAESEHYRRGRDTEYKTAGATFWMLDDNWPAESWTSLEWGGRPKLLHYTAMRFNAKVAVSTFCTPSIMACAGLAVHVSSELLSSVSGTLGLTAIRWKDGKAGNATTTQVVLKPQSGANVTVAGADFAAILASAGCNSVAECFVEARLHSPGAIPADRDTRPALLAPVTHQWLALWRNVTLAPARLALTAAPSPDGRGVAVTVSSDAVAPMTMVHCRNPGDFGAFDANGVTLMPSEPQTLTYTPKAFAPGGPHDPCTVAEDFYAVAINGLSD